MPLNRLLSHILVVLLCLVLYDAADDHLQATVEHGLDKLVWLETEVVVRCVVGVSLVVLNHEQDQGFVGVYEVAFDNVLGPLAKVDVVFEITRILVKLVFKCLCICSFLNFELVLKLFDSFLKHFDLLRKEFTESFTLLKVQLCRFIFRYIAETLKACSKLVFFLEHV